jgi:hypothetical protein
VHPMFVTLFIETDADDELTRGQDQQPRAPGQAQQVSPGHQAPGR